MTDEVYMRETGVEDCEYLEVCEHACRTGCRAYKPRVDRDALLRIAEDLDYEGMGGWADTVNVGSYARRIREALGVENGD